MFLKCRKISVGPEKFSSLNALKKILCKVQVQAKMTIRRLFLLGLRKFSKNFEEKNCTGKTTSRPHPQHVLAPCLHVHAQSPVGIHSQATPLLIVSSPSDCRGPSLVDRPSLSLSLEASGDIIVLDVAPLFPLLKYVQIETKYC